MSKTTADNLSNVAEKLLVTLYIRAMESQRSDALIKDGKAEALIKKISDNGLYDSGSKIDLHIKTAVYTELVGAPFSHAGIVAREMGIPAVSSCGNTTMLLKTGDRVRLDDERETFEILPRRVRTETGCIEE
jgi:phosphohistidine swiveling domain-containing protein